MGSRITKIFYGNDCLPYKDRDRTVHYPVTGYSFAGSSRVNQLHFYTRDIGGVNTLSWVAIVKLPNGKILYQLLSDIHLDDEIGEYYVSFDLTSYYTQLKGDLYISLNGCKGQVEITTDEETDITTIEGEIDSKTIVSTGAIKFTINYAPQRPIGYDFDIDQYATIINALGNKANVFNTIQIVANISDIDVDDYNVGQLFYCLTNKEYYQVELYNEYFKRTTQVLLDDKHYLVRYVGANLRLDQLYALFGYRLFLFNDVLVQFSEYSSTKTNITILEFGEQYYYFAEEVSVSQTFEDVYVVENLYAYRKQTQEEHVVYATDNDGYDTEINYGIPANGNYIVRRDSNGQIKVLLQPSANNDAVSKKYVDDGIATIKANQFIVVNDVVTYPSLDSFKQNYPNPEEGYIYLYPYKPSETPTFQSGYYQLIWEGNAWLEIGTTQLDLSNYYTKGQTDTLLGTKLDKKTNTNTLYGVNGSGNQSQYAFGSNVTNNNIVQRNGNGQVLVPQTPTDNSHSTSKYYVDNLGNTKVDKTSSSEKVYGTDELGAQTTYSVDSDLVGDGSVVRRNDTTGTIVTGTPTAVNHATTKAYVDTNIANAISNVYKIKGSATVQQINLMSISSLQVGDVYNLLDSGTITAGDLQVFTGDNIVWSGSAWDKLGAEIDWSAYDEKFIAAGFFEVQPYNEDTGEITIVYSTELYIMSYDGGTGVMTIEAN